ncbi:MAG: Na+-transporting NADH:ubiquinone oxidoreductase subunit C [Saprospiraceae bacterium]|jgi:Na+-transporting NADH:ubiquinone oxidoreductase subunit C
MTVIVAVVLAGMNTALKDIHTKNEAIFNKKAILAAVQSELGENIKADDLPDEEVQSIFDNKITQHVIDYKANPISKQTIQDRGYKGGMAEHIDMKKEKKRSVEDRYFPVFEFDSGGDKIYIVSVRGKGLWDDIWGNIAIKDDFKTVVGASFDHTGETAGLGAEIKDNPGFSRQFQGKKLYNEAGDYTSVVVRKGGAKNPIYEVDGISGATVTANGVSDMLYDGIAHYLPYFNSL